MSSPVAIDMDEFYVPLVKAARRGELLPIEGVLVRDWAPDSRRTSPGATSSSRRASVMTGHRCGPAANAR